MHGIGPLGQLRQKYSGASNPAVNEEEEEVAVRGQDAKEHGR